MRGQQLIKSYRNLIFCMYTHISIKKLHGAIKFNTQGHWRSKKGKKKKFISGLKFNSSIKPYLCHAGRPFSACILVIIIILYTHDIDFVAVITKI